MKLPDEIIAYFDALPGERRAMLQALHERIAAMYPDCEIDMRYRMPTCHRGDGWVAIASRKQYVSLYTCGEHHLAEFRERQPRIRTGKGCINFKAGSPLPLDDIERVVAHAIEHPKP